MNEFIEGARARATKCEVPDRYRNNYSDHQAFWAGYNHMTQLLSPIETKIIVETIRYRSVADAELRKLEHGAATGSAEPTVPSERPQVPAAPRDL